MDFDHAIVAHVSWKSKVRHHMQGTETLVASEVAKDDRCELGKWLHSQEQEYHGKPEFDEAVQAHAQFHRVAGDVIHQSKKVSQEEMEKMIASGSEYGKASAHCVAALTALRDAVKNW